MDDVLIWLKNGLLLGGALTAQIGVLWYVIAKMLRFFGEETNPKKGFKVMVIGLAMLGVGLLMHYG